MKFTKNQIIAVSVAVFFLILLAGSDNLSTADNEVNLQLLNTEKSASTYESIQNAGEKTENQNDGQKNSPPAGGSTQEDHEKKYYSIIKVIDGDTLSINKHGEKITLRLIGLDTPETVHPTKPVQCFGKESSQKAKNMLSGRVVRIEMDQTQGTYDKYGRTLAYVYLEDGTFFNKHMIEEGYGYEYTYDLPYKYQAEFKQAQKEAQENQRGLWAPGVCEDIVTEAMAAEPKVENIQKATQQTTEQEKATNSNDYICSYNAYNCGNFTTHAEAQAAYEACGGVNNDIHRLDKDKDGVACESLQ